MRARFTWPLARIELEDDRFALTARRPLKLLLRPTVVRYSEIAEIRTLPSRLASMIEFRSTRPEVDGAFFVAMNSKFGELVNLFHSHGVSIN
jgi:hypothetical protein